jgi:hypothetical protein
MHPTSIIINQFGVDTLISQGDEFELMFLDYRRNPQKHICRMITRLDDMVEVLTNNATLSWPLSHVVEAERLVA